MDKFENIDGPYLHVQRTMVGKRIREIRKLRGLSQSALAEAMNVQRTTISKIENGKFAITIDYLTKFSFYLNFDLVLIDKFGDNIE